MSAVLTQPPVIDAVRVKRPIIAAETKEFIAVCSKCGTIETAWFTKDDLIVPTRKFTQPGYRIYHDCGTDVSCHLYRIS